jgi:hypothetical protein
MFTIKSNWVSSLVELLSGTASSLRLSSLVTKVPPSPT